MASRSTRWRALIALILLLSMPLRTVAGVAMPCCPLPDAPTRSEATVAMGAVVGIVDHDMPMAPAPASGYGDEATYAMQPMEAPSDPMHVARDAVPPATPSHGSDGGHPGHHAPIPNCCSVATVAATMVGSSLARYVPPLAVEPRVAALAAFITDAPERPPRTSPPA